jgi:hypothetical protein
MKKYKINVHYDMVISTEVIADSISEACRLAREKADSMDHEARELVATDCQLADNDPITELTTSDVRRMEREAVTEFVVNYIEQQTPTEVFCIAHGSEGLNWVELNGPDEPQWRNELFLSISDMKHADTALFDRYARMYARQRWQQVADRQARDWDHAWAEARRDPERLRVIVETIENDGEDGNRYYMIDGSTEESGAEWPGDWYISRNDIVTSPYPVRRPNYNHLHNYFDDQAQPTCRVSNPNNLTRWAEKMIRAGRVLDIYAESY